MLLIGNTTVINLLGNGWPCDCIMFTVQLLYALVPTSEVVPTENSVFQMNNLLPENIIYIIYTACLVPITVHLVLIHLCAICCSITGQNEMVMLLRNLKNNWKKKSVYCKEKVA